MHKQAAFFIARRAERRSMNELNENIKTLKDGQVLKIYFERFGKEAVDGRNERTGVYPRGAELQFYHGGFRTITKAAPDFVDTLPDNRVYTKKTSLIHRMQAGRCELCGGETDTVIMHHVRKLKDLKGTTGWERKMIEIKRKSLAVCPKCYEPIKTQVQ